MNNARTTFLRRGSMLVALAAAVLLAAPATALAQSVMFSATTGTVKEGVAANAAGAFQVTVTKSASVSDTGVTFTTSPALSTLGVTVTGTPALSGADGIRFTRNQAVLTIVQADENSNDRRNWLDEKLIIALRAPAGTTIGRDLVLTLDDKQVQPTATFSKTSIKLTEDSRQSASVRVGVPTGTAMANTPDYAGFTDSTTATGNTARHRLRLKVEPANGIGTSGTAAGRGPLTMTFGTQGIGNGANQIVAGMPGMFTLPVNPNTASMGTGVAFNIMANADTTGFKNPMVKLTLMDVDLKLGTGAGTSVGTLKGGPPLMVEVLSDEAIPTVSFSPTEISIKEGGRTTAALISEGKQGSEVNMVSLSVSGTAMVDLWMGTKKLAPVDGKITVSLAGTNLARVTARSTSDRSLMDGQMKSKTWRITDADGAKIDADANSLTVTVEGSTAVPALPLVAQLLLALFLTAGGAKLYRRRRN